MKIAPEDYEELKRKIENFVTSGGIIGVHSLEELDRKAADLGVSDKRIRWDIFNAAVPYASWTKRVYDYANDENIDTALRKIFRHPK